MRLLSVMLACLLCATILPAQRQVVRSLQFMNFEPIPVSEILQRLKEKDVKLSTERAYDPQEVDAAKTVLESLLVERGKSGFRVNVTTRTVPPRSLEITFTAVAK